MQRGAEWFFGSLSKDKTNLARFFTDFDGEPRIFLILNASARDREDVFFGSLVKTVFAVDCRFSERAV
jgi:hypothetical protein